MPLYVGKGSGERWKRHKARAASNAHYKAVIDQNDGRLPVVIVAGGLSEQKAFALEAVLTESIGIESEGGPLVNCGHGGRGGPAGVKRSPEWCAHRRLKALELWQNADYRAVMLRTDRGRGGNKKPRSPKFRADMSERLIGNTYTLGYVHTTEAREKISAVHKGKPKSQEHRNKIGEANRLAWKLRAR